jgi:hypothetical protein
MSRSGWIWLVIWPMTAVREDFNSGSRRRSTRRFLGDAVDEGAQVEAARSIDKVDVGRRGEGVVAMLFGVIVRGEEGGKHDDRMQDCQERDGEGELHAVRSFHEVRILGSAR